MPEPSGTHSAHSSEMEIWSNKLCLASLSNCITSVHHGIMEEKSLKNIFIGIYANFRASLKDSGK